MVQIKSADESRLTRALCYALPLLCFLPAFIFRDYTPNNELRYVSLIDEALARGNIFAFTNHGLPYADKPPLYFWLMMLGRILTGEGLPVFIGCVNILTAGAIVGVMNRWCFGDAPSSKWLPPTLMLLTTGLFAGATLVLRMDLLMTLFILLALRTFFKLHQGRGTKDDRWLLPLWVFLALFTKGPVGVIAPVLTIVAFLAVRHELRTVGRYLGWVFWGVLVGLCALWWSAVWLEGGTDYLNNLLFHQTVDRAVDSFHHKGPFYFYLLRFWGLAAPWSLFAGIGFILGCRLSRLEGNALRQLFACAVLTTLLFLSAISSKVDIYLLPAYPFIVYFAWLLWPDIKHSRWMSFALWVPTLILLLIVPLGLIALAVTPLRMMMMAIEPMVMQLPWPWLAAATLLVLFGGSASAAWMLAKRRRERAVVVLAQTVLAVICLGSFQLEGLNAYIGWRKLAEAAMTLGHEAKTPRYYSFGLSRAENLDAYLHVEVDPLVDLNPLREDDVTMRRPFVLFTSDKAVNRNDSLRHLLDNRRFEQVGNNRVYLIE
jgi:4-amino-4-deoxy-L-arabinose transferase-like glycosyltransferase